MKTIFKTLFVTLLLFSCGNDDDNNNNQGDYNEICSDVVCTEEFVTLTITVTDSYGDPVALDDITVTRLVGEGEVIFDEVPDTGDDGTYPIYDDRFVEESFSKAVEVNFKGYIDGNEVADENFTFTADCCHVSMLSDDTVIVVDTDDGIN